MFAFADGVQLREDRERRLFSGIEATLFIVNGDKENARRVLGIEDGDDGRDGAELLEEFDLDASSDIGRKVIEEQERREADAWYAKFEGGG